LDVHTDHLKTGFPVGDGVKVGGVHFEYAGVHPGKVLLVEPFELIDLLFQF
jgi:hypothetical protein